MTDAELERLRDELRASSMAALGQLAAGVAHEINNPLAVLQMGLEQLAVRLDEHPQLRDDALVLVEHCERIARIVENLDDFARPRAPADDAPRPEPSAAPAARPGLRVLCVEDEPVLRTLLATMLRELGHLPTAVRSAEDAVDALAGGSFDVVLTDIQLPGESGHWLLRTIDAEYPTLGARVILMSGHFQTVPKGQPCLQKPFGFEELGQALAEIAT